MGQDTTQIGVECTITYTEDAPPQRPVSISKPIFPADAQVVQQGPVLSAYSPLYPFDARETHRNSVDGFVTEKSNVPVQISNNPPIPRGVLGGRSANFGGIGRALSHLGAMGVRTPAIGET